MAAQYSLFVRQEAFLRLLSVRSRQRHQILSFFDSLERDPFQIGDYEMQSREGRPVQVKIIGTFALLFWADHSVCEIKVVDMVPADA